MGYRYAKKSSKKNYSNYKPRKSAYKPKKKAYGYAKRPKPKKRVPVAGAARNRMYARMVELAQRLAV